MKTNDTLNVFYDNRHVGTLAMTNSHKVAFQYSEESPGNEHCSENG